MRVCCARGLTQLRRSGYEDILRQLRRVVVTLGVDVAIITYACRNGRGSVWDA